MDYYSNVPGAGLTARRRAASITSISRPPAGGGGASCSGNAPSADAAASDLAQVDIPTDKVGSLFRCCHYTLRRYRWLAAVDADVANASLRQLLMQLRVLLLEPSSEWRVMSAEAGRAAILECLGQ